MMYVYFTSALRLLNLNMELSIASMYWLHLKNDHEIYTKSKSQ